MISSIRSNTAFAQSGGVFVQRSLFLFSPYLITQWASNWQDRGADYPPGRCPGNWTHANHVTIAFCRGSWQYQSLFRCSPSVPLSNLSCCYPSSPEPGSISISTGSITAVVAAPIVPSSESASLRHPGPRRAPMASGRLSPDCLEREAGGIFVITNSWYSLTSKERMIDITQKSGKSLNWLAEIWMTWRYVTYWEQSGRKLWNKRDGICYGSRKRR